MSSQIKIFTCSNTKHLIFHFIILIKRGLSFKGVVDTSYYLAAMSLFCFFSDMSFDTQHSLLNVTYHQFVY